MGSLTMCASGRQQGARPVRGSWRTTSPVARRLVENTSSGHTNIMPIAGSAALTSAVGLEYEHADVQIEQ